MVLALFPWGIPGGHRLATGASCGSACFAAVVLCDVVSSAVPPRTVYMYRGTSRAELKQYVVDRSAWSVPGQKRAQAVAILV